MSCLHPAKQRDLFVFSPENALRDIRESLLKCLEQCKLFYVVALEKNWIIKSSAHALRQNKNSQVEYRCKIGSKTKLFRHNLPARGVELWNYYFKLETTTAIAARLEQQTRAKTVLFMLFPRFQMPSNSYSSTQENRCLRKALLQAYMRSETRLLMFNVFRINFNSFTINSSLYTFIRYSM